MNTNTAPVTTIQYATNVNMGGHTLRDNILEKLPRHPDLGDEWADYAQGSRSSDIDTVWGWANDPEGNWYSGYTATPNRENQH
ncbi:hypothetical protein FA13DRAFT_1798047 [Coprinellus micaceus]|uniref:Uncharacterized protein n=1 Tax=Coprinellus micaceus TaxID=71717 RepID=A0A4Y7SNG0_COPMI|nr:hypothetical protein FA13DRAFT_1798047 [Coprinellus micaceus]